jgi:hypothetical protein
MSVTVHRGHTPTALVVDAVKIYAAVGQRHGVAHWTGERTVQCYTADNCPLWVCLICCAAVMGVGRQH